MSKKGEEPEAYVALARRYRPRRLADVVGQEAVVSTIENALREGRSGSAYLFTGPRGVGKTTLARILAMSLNCEKGKPAEPCGRCDPCQRIATGDDLDVLEIDGASHNGVDEIRRIQEVVSTAPVRGRHRIYLIDEVHMLSASAFNALLKTLEEPPPHAKFLFATTHPHKIPPTVLSRCQRFDLRRIAPGDIAARLAEISRKEGIPVEKEAIAAIADCADGGLRDALTILDQVRAYAQGGKVTAEAVRAMMGLADPGEAQRLLDAALAGDVGAVLAGCDRLWIAGADFAPYARLLLERIRESLAGASAPERAPLGRLARSLLDALPQISPDRIGKAAFEWALLAPPEAAADAPAPPAGVRKDPPPARPPAPAASAEAPAAPPPPGPKGPAARRAAGVSPEAFRSGWAAFLAAVRERRKTTGAFLAEAQPAGAGEGWFELAFRSSFHRDQVESSAHRTCVEEAFREMFGAEAKLRATLAEGAAAAPEGKDPAARPAAAPQDAPPGAGDPLVRKAAEIFHGRIVTRRKETES